MNIYVYGTTLCDIWSICIVYRKHVLELVPHFWTYIVFVLVNNMIYSNVNLSQITIHSKFLSTGIWVFFHDWVAHKYAQKKIAKDDENTVHTSYIIIYIIVVIPIWLPWLMLTYQIVLIILIFFFSGRSSGNMYTQLQFWISWINRCVAFLLIMVRYQYNRYLAGELHI